LILKERDRLKATHEKAQAELQAALEAAQADLSRVQAQHERLASELDALRVEMTTQIALRDKALAKFAQTAETAQIHCSELQATIERQRNELRHLTAQAESRRVDDPPQADPPPRDAPKSAGTVGEYGQTRSRLRQVVSGLARRGARTPSPRQQAAALRKSAYFDADWYAATYPECGGPAKAAAHYLREGAFVGYDPSPAFSTIGYYQRNPDVAESDWAALAHYIAHGQSEGRAFDPLMASEQH
jgi:chaperonin cofactor prefoldin